LTFEPHRLSDADIDALRKHYTDLQILEMILSTAGNNAINRWKEGTGSPQSESGGGFGRNSDTPPADRPARHTYLTPTSDAYKTRLTKVAPIETAAKPGEHTAPTVCKRPALESREDVESAIAAARKRSARLPLVDEAKAREILGSDAPAGPVPEWVRLLVNFPVSGKARVQSQRAAEEKGDLTPLLKAQLAWIIARQDRAWYAAGRAKQRLKDLGQSADQVYALDRDWARFKPADRSLFTVAKKLAASPIVLTDADVAEALRLNGPKEVVQTIMLTTTCASFDRITEAAGLRLEK
jgi:alkylhydroperoxidase family enzyme